MILLRSLSHVTDYIYDALLSTLFDDYDVSVKRGGEERGGMDTPRNRPPRPRAPCRYQMTTGRVIVLHLSQDADNVSMAVSSLPGKNRGVSRFESRIFPDGAFFAMR